MHAIWGLGMLSLTKGVVVVDEHVDVHDYEQVMFYVGANVDPKRDVVITEGPLDHLDHAPTLQFVGGKIGIDATAKSPAEGRPRVAAGDRDDRRDPRSRRPPLGRVRHRDGSRGGERRNQSEFALCANCYVVDAWAGGPLESRLDAPTSRHLPSPAQPLAGRLRRRRRRAPGRPHHLLVGRRPGRAGRARLRVPLGARPDRPSSALGRARGPPETRRRRARTPGGRARRARLASEERFPRTKFLEVSTLGLGAVIGGIVTAPAVGFMVAPAFLKQGEKDHDLGPLTDFPEGKYVIATFMSDPSQGEVSRRTAFVRYNGPLNGLPSFTIISNHCAHLGCPVQPNGPLDGIEEEAERRRDADPDDLDRRLRLPVPRRPVRHRGQPHGGPAGARARPLLVLDPQRPPLRRPAVLGLARRRHRGATRRSTSGRSRSPASTSSGIESWLYPIQPPH